MNRDDALKVIDEYQGTMHLDGVDDNVTSFQDMTTNDLVVIAESILTLKGKKP